MTTPSVGRPGGDNPTCHSPPCCCGGDHGNHRGAFIHLCPEDKKRLMCDLYALDCTIDTHIQPCHTHIIYLQGAHLKGEYIVALE